MGTFSDEAISAILLGPAVVSRAPFPLAPPDSGITVGVRCLVETEIDEAQVRAQCYLEGLCKRNELGFKTFVDIDPEGLEREKKRQMIAVAFRDPDNESVPFFASVVQVRKLNSVAVSRLWELYMEHHDKVNPYYNLSKEQAVELADAIKKELPGADLLAGFGRDTLCSLVRSLAGQLAT